MTPEGDEWNADVECRISEHVLAIEGVLASRGISVAERRSIADDVEAQIRELLSTRCEVAPTRADVEAVLAELDPPESFAEVEEERPHAEEPAVAPRLSKAALIGALWAPFVLPVCYMLLFYRVRVPAGERPSQPALAAMLVLTLIYVLGGTAPLGTTALGLSGISAIRHSRGRLYGLALAVADALFFPLIVLDTLILWGTGYGCVALWTMMHPQARGRGVTLLPGLAIGVFIVLVVDILIICWAWWAAKKPVDA